MAIDPRYAGKIKPSAQLMKDSDDLMRLTHRELFPDSPRLDLDGVRARHEAV